MQMKNRDIVFHLIPNSILITPTELYLRFGYRDTESRVY